MVNDYSQFEQRKQDHIECALMSDNQAVECQAFDEIVLQHDALPDFNFSDIDIQSTRFGQPVANPFIISSMTAGHTKAQPINRHFMAACALSGWAMGVGSQRRELTDTLAANEWRALRADYPKVSLFSNLGIAQLISTPLDKIRQLTDVLQADALFIHCNPLQECIQPEGTPQFRGCWDALEHLVTHSDLPIIVKETGCGFSTSTLQRLNNLGVHAVDVSGLGGTHWGRIEGVRALRDHQRAQTAVTFRNWGINTVQSIQNARRVEPRFEIWGSGGVRHGLDAAKLLALGATSIGFAKPLLQAALVSSEEVYAVMNTIMYELKVAMFCTGSRVLRDLQEKICTP